MESFLFHLPTRILFGSGKLAEAGQEARKLGKRPLLLTGRKAMRENGVLSRVEGLLHASGVEPLLFDKVEPNPRCETLDQGLELARLKRCDFVIGLGGGSSMDAAKAVAAALVEPEAKSVWEFSSGMGAKRRKVRRLAPTLLLSTTAASGSEGNCAAVITKWETREKAVLWDLGAFPDTSIVDPELMLSLPLEVTRDGVVDMMLHVLEQTFNGDAEAYFLDRTVEGMVRGMIEGLERVEAHPRDLTARENLAWASVFALVAGGGPNWGRSGHFTVHHLEHPLSGHSDCSHGHGLAALWPRYLPVILEKQAAKIAQWGHAVFGAPTAEKTLQALETWLRNHGLWFCLRDFGVSEEMIPQMAADAIRLSGDGEGFLQAPVPISQQKAEAIYRSAW